MRSLIEALDPQYPEVVALVGAGGKTTTMLALAIEARAAGKTALITTTTKIFPPDPAVFGPALYTEDQLAGKPLAVYAAGQDPATGKLLGIDPDHLPVGFDWTLVEADGSARKPLTAPREGEPVIPAATTMVLAVAGLSAIGRPVADMHRPEVIHALTGVPKGAVVTPEVMAAILSHPAGNTRGRPAGARVTYLLNQADGPEREDLGRRVARELAHGLASGLASGLDRPVLLTSRGRVVARIG
ncbi:MAG: selenium cofactor biosynthesis protein YqeC [Chloroflexota bacterium]